MEVKVYRLENCVTANVLVDTKSQESNDRTITEHSSEDNHPKVSENDSDCLLLPKVKYEEIMKDVPFGAPLQEKTSFDPRVKHQAKRVNQPEDMLLGKRQQGPPLNGDQKEQLLPTKKMNVARKGMLK